VVIHLKSLDNEENAQVIRETLQSISGVEEVTVSVANREVRIVGDLEYEAVRDILQQIGFEIE